MHFIMSYAWRYGLDLKSTLSGKEVSWHCVPKLLLTLYVYVNERENDQIKYYISTIERFDLFSLCEYGTKIQSISEWIS